MKTALRSFALLLGIGMIFPASSLALGPNGSISLDSLLSRRLTGGIPYNYALGGSLLLEFRPIDAFSIGVGADLRNFVGMDVSGLGTVESVNLVGRGIFNGGGTWQPYLTGGYGLNPKVDMQGDFTWWGNYHVMGGLGTFYFFDPQWAVDLAVLYNYFESGADPLQTVDVRIGFSYFFEPALKTYSLIGKASANAGRPQDAKPRQAKPVESAAAQPITQALIIKPGAPFPGVKTAAQASGAKPAKSMAETKPAAGLLTAGTTGQKAKPTPTVVPYGSAIGPKGLASFRGPSSPVEKTNPLTTAPAVKTAVAAPASKAAAKKAGNELEKMEEELEDETDETPVSKATLSRPQTVGKPAKSAGKQTTPTAAAKTSPGQVAFREPVTKAATAVPISKPAIPTPAAKTPAPKATVKTPAGQVAFREPAPAQKTKSSAPTPVVKFPPKTVTPVSKAQPPVPKTASKTPLGQVAFRSAAPASSSSPSVKTSGFAEATPAKSGDMPEEPGEITTLKGQSLWNTAARKDVYGDPGLYPLLVDANRKTLKPDQMALKAGTKLTVPRGVSEAMMQKARANAWSNDYMRYRGIGLSKPAYEKWLKKNKVSN